MVSNKDFDIEVCIILDGIIWFLYFDVYLKLNGLPSLEVSVTVSECGLHDS